MHKKKIKNNKKKHNKYDQDEIFNAYHLNYKGEPDETKKDKAVELQHYMYTKLNEKGLENTAIEKLLDLTIEDMQKQQNLKLGLENKAGFLLTLWGILVVALLNNGMIEKIKYNICNEYNVFCTLVSVALLICSSVYFLIHIYNTIKIHRYTKFMFDEKEDNFRSAVDTKNLTYIVMLDNITTSWNENRKSVGDVAKNYKKSIIAVIMFLLSLIISIYLLA